MPATCPYPELHINNVKEKEMLKRTYKRDIKENIQKTKYARDESRIKCM
jgi:hypothetical protein